ncbi:hypothetical protein DY000_02037189, partial [Brassica cretica]
RRKASFLLSSEHSPELGFLLDRFRFFILIGCLVRFEMAPVPDPNNSEEDLELKQNLELYVERVQDPNPELQKAALESMR